MASGAQPLSNCPPCDCNGDGLVNGADLVSMANAQAYGCAAARPTPGGGGASGGNYAVNPMGTEARGNRQTRIKNPSDRAPINQPILPADPDRSETGDAWCVNTASEHRCCYRWPGKTYYSAYEAR